MLTLQMVERCPICRSQKIQTRFVFQQRYTIAQCVDCQHQFIAPQPTDETLAQIYTADYFLGDHTPEAEAQVSALKRATAALYIDTLITRSSLQSGRLLEVGCGTGDLLAEAQARGFDVAGLELSAAAVQTANRRLGGEYVQCGTLDTVAWPTGAFEVCVMADVIEHMRDPLAGLRRVQRLLKPGGLILIVTPSLDSWSARLLRHDWMEYKLEHLSYFGQRSMRAALEATGFGEVQILPNYKVLSLAYITWHFRRFPVPGFTPLSRGLLRLLPRAWTVRPLKLVASGMLVLARARTA